MMLTLDISNKEFDSIVGLNDEVTPIIFLSFPSDIRGVYEFELMNSVINIFDFKDQIVSQGIDIKDDALFVFGKMKIRIEKVKGADVKLVEGDFHTGRKHYHTWPYTLKKGDVICKCGGDLSFLNEYHASIIIVTENTPRITVTFNTGETIPYDFMNVNSVRLAHSKKTKYERTRAPGKLFDHNFFQEYLGSGRKVLKDE